MARKRAREGVPRTLRARGDRPVICTDHCCRAGPKNSSPSLVPGPSCGKYSVFACIWCILCVFVRHSGIHSRYTHIQLNTREIQCISGHDANPAGYVINTPKIRNEYVYLTEYTQIRTNTHKILYSQKNAPFCREKGTGPAEEERIK